MSVGIQQLDFAEFYRSAADECLRTVVVSIGDQDAARELVDEAFARAWASWRTVSRHPAPKAWVVRTALNAGISRWRRHRREVPVPDPARVTDLPAAGGASLGLADPQIMRADGLPVNVTFSGPLLSASCQPYQTGPLNTVPAVTQIHGDNLVIDPSALPSGAGLAIFDEPGAGLPVWSGTTPTLGGTPPARPSIPPLLKAIDGPLAVGLVYASPACTG